MTEHTTDCPYCAQEKAWTKFDSDALHHAGGVLCAYTQFGPVARHKIGIQAQYASRYIDGLNDYLALGKGLRFRNWPNAGMNYHSIEIHRDDVDEFVRRVLAHRNGEL
jgi:hypothetical protein